MSQPDSTAQAANPEPRFFPEFCFMAPEEVNEFAELFRGYSQQYEPAGAVQITVFDNLVHAAWELVRCRRLEAALCGSFRSYVDLVNDDKVQRKLDWIARRKGQFERSFNRSLKEMKALKAEAPKKQPAQPTFAQMSPAQLKAEAERIIARRKTGISERSQPDSPHNFADEIEFPDTA